MKLKLSVFILILTVISSCQKDSYYLDDNQNQEDIPFNFSLMKEGDKLPIFYSETKGKNIIKEYSAVKIGEYLWMNSNFTEPVEPSHSISQRQVDLGLSAYYINNQDYKLTPGDINKYIGEYYNRNSLEFMEYNGNMYEGDNKIDRGKWGLPSIVAFRQLFGMCGDASEQAVRTTLCYKPNEIPIAKITPNIFWLTTENTNKYGFNLIYAGQRAHTNNFLWSNGYSTFTSNIGDFILFYGAAVFPTSDASTVILHDYPDTNRVKSWAWLTIRWCRKLTDKELGYKLYVNNDRSDIKKTGLDEMPPEGYTELENGYLRGFYIQHILNNPNPTLTVSQLRQMELNIVEVKHGSVKPI